MGADRDFFKSGTRICLIPFPWETGWVILLKPEYLEGEAMNERRGMVTFNGNPLTLIGDEISVGMAAPDVEAVSTDMKPVKPSAYRGKVVILATVPSLDTPVCDVETRRFNREAMDLGPDVVVLTVSRDLPFAQKRWCGAAGVDRVITLSDYAHGTFGRAWGIYIQENALLARTVFVLDREGIVRYIQIVPEVVAEPDYTAVIKAAKALG
jgi:thiol peroxidase